MWPKWMSLTTSKTANLLGFSCTTISMIYRERGEKRKFLRCNNFGERSPKWMDRLDEAERKTILAQMTSVYIGDM